jgi:hypothetical protein
MQWGSIARVEAIAMVSRHWKDVARREEADNYVAHLKDETFPRLASTRRQRSFRRMRRR